MNLNNISIILVKPQMGENIGSAARIMKNFGLKDLRIVAPRDGWPNPKAVDMSANAVDIIKSAGVFDDLEAAVADLHFLAASTARKRDMVKDETTPRGLAEKISTEYSDKKIGILFGAEASGLENSSISLCNSIVTVPVSEEYRSINIAQAVCVIAYEIFQQSLSENDIPAKKDMVERKDINEMLNFLEGKLDESNFFQVPDKKPGMMINIRNIFTRHDYTEQEIRTLRGIFTALKKKN